MAQPASPLVLRRAPCPAPLHPPHSMPHRRVMCCAPRQPVCCALQCSNGACAPSHATPGPNRPSPTSGRGLPTALGCKRGGLWHEPRTFAREGQGGGRAPCSTFLPGALTGAGRSVLWPVAGAAPGGVHAGSTHVLAYLAGGQRIDLLPRITTVHPCECLGHLASCVQGLTRAAATPA